MSTIYTDSLSNSKPVQERFINLRQQKKIKEFLLRQRGYKRPDFNRILLDLGRLGWTHEKIAFLLPVAGASTVSEWARGGTPNFENGEALIELWKAETGVERFPRDGEWSTYKYEIGQLKLL
ncbi:hypothetical protein [Acinetobacter equi]|uniref:Uncharacterized protein n=1 Tax=Acinetobacter equi TaxID=1324350 RepID=A0A0N9VZM8_9GAMM|nr:hypothetical protein [Acinetobacter equi]ALH95665.1 hypothetical protein AOY20_09055 [Acinetobacter equi]